MTINLAAAAPSCTGTWAQKWNCGWKTSPGVAQAGYDAGHSLIPLLAVLLVAFLVVSVVRKRRKSSTPATAGARR
jgi:LPXTG-motif cell wall-anchored protein